MIRAVMGFCGHVSCLDRELEALATLEYEVWRLSSRGGPGYRFGMARLAEKVSDGAVRRE